MSGYACNESPPLLEGRRDLRAEIRFDIGDTDCLLAIHDGNDLLDHHILGDTCYVVSGDAETAGITHEEADVDSCPGCPCTVFRRHHCVPHFDSIDEGHAVVTTYPPDRERLQRLIGDLRDVVGHVSLRRLSKSGVSGFTDIRTADLSLLTGRESEVLGLAIASGYYDDPRGIEFETLAEELEISKPSLSQRLRAAESKLLLDLLED